ncbi:MAG: peroxiredoxin family protein [Flavobacteriales bacterium]|nr:peroxiredoxin family protein [Flavobacteriales bacterium]
MTRLHQPLTWTAVALSAVGSSLIWTTHGLAGSALLLVAQVLALAEFKKYTGRFQFGMIIGSAAGLGISIDVASGALGPATVPLALSALAIVLRQAYLPVFTYVNKRWMEPVLLGASAVPLSITWLNAPFTITTHLFPLVTFGAGVFLCASYMQDAVMMRRSTRKGYRVQPGMVAPDFILPDQQGGSVRLSDHQGRHPVLLIFVRGDWCPGCHMMLRTYEKHHERFKSRGVHVIGIGPDSVEANRDMVRRIGVGYQLLSDSSQEVSQRYGVVYENPAIETVVDYAEGIPLPASFLVDVNGIVRYVSRPDRIGEFLDPTLIFGVLDQLPQADPSSTDLAHERAA